MPNVPSAHHAQPPALQPRSQRFGKSEAGLTHAQIVSRRLARAAVGYEVEADLGTFRARSRLEAGADDYGIAHPWVRRARVEGKQRRHEWQVKGAQTRLVLPRTTVCQVAAKQGETVLPSEAANN